MTFLKRRFPRAFSALERYAGTDIDYLAESGFWMNVSSVIISLLSLGLYVVFANFLSRETYGIYQYFLAASAILATLTLTGMNSAVTRAVAQGHDGTLIRAVRFQLKASIVPFCIAGAVSLYYLLQGNVIFSVAFLLIGALMPLANAFNTFGAYFVGKKQFARSTAYGLVQYLPYYAVLAGTAVIFPSALMLLAVNLVATVTATWLLYIRVIHKDKPSEPHQPGALRYGTNLSFANAFPAVVSQLDAVLAFQFLGPGALAVYAFATAIPDRLGSLFKFFPVAALPKFAERTDEEIRKTIAPKLIKLGVLAVMFAGAYALVVPFFFQLFFPTYLDAIPYSQAYALALVLIVSSVATAALTARARTKALFAVNIITPLIGLGFQCFGVIFFGLWGLVIGKIASAFASSVVATLILLYGKARPEPQSL